MQQLDLVALSDASLGNIATSLGTTADGLRPAGGRAARTVFGFDPLPFTCPGPSETAGGGGFQRGGFDLSVMLVGGVAVAVSPPGSPSITFHPTGLQPNITLARGSAVLLRVLNASPGRPFMLALGWGRGPPAARDPPPLVALSLVAIDGVALAAPVAVTDGLPLTAPGYGMNLSGGLLLPPGGRYDLRAEWPTAVGANSSALPVLWGNVAVCATGTPACPGLSPFPIASFVLDPGLAGYASGSSAPQANGSLANCSAGGGSVNCSDGGASPPPHIAPGGVSVRRRFVLSEQRDPPSAPLAPGDDGGVNRDVDPLSLTATGFYINNRTFDPARVDVPGVLLGSTGGRWGWVVGSHGAEAVAQGPYACSLPTPPDAAEEWWIDNPSPARGHPWHVHTRHFEVVAVCALPVGAPTGGAAIPPGSQACGGGPGAGGPDLLRAPYWSDTVWVPAGARLVTRLRFDRFAGRSLFHCHILPHEDLGMMGVYEVVG